MHIEPLDQRESQLRTSDGIQLWWYQRRHDSYTDFWSLGESTYDLDAYALVYKLDGEHHYRIKVLDKVNETADDIFLQLKDNGTVPNLEEALKLAEVWVKHNGVL